MKGRTQTSAGRRLPNKQKPNRKHRSKRKRPPMVTLYPSMTTTHPDWLGQEILAVGQDVATGALTRWEAEWLLDRGPGALSLLEGWPSLEIAKVYAERPLAAPEGA